LDAGPIVPLLLRGKNGSLKFYARERLEKCFECGKIRPLHGSISRKLVLKIVDENSVWEQFEIRAWNVAGEIRLLRGYWKFGCSEE
jgi:hypothetical protein